MPFFPQEKWHSLFMRMYVILASNSPRRRELLQKICPVFAVRSADADEGIGRSVPPGEAVKRLALRKAESVFKTARNAGMATTGEPLVVLGADTVVCLDGAILGKPKDEEDAARILRLLSGRTHEVYTGVCCMTERGARLCAARSEVIFRTLTDEEIAAYIATGSPMDKAGAYGIQDGAVVAGYTGSYTNIVGLPLELTAKLLQEVKRDVENSHRSGHIDDQDL